MASPRRSPTPTPPPADSPAVGSPLAVPNIPPHRPSTSSPHPQPAATYGSPRASSAFPRATVGTPPSGASNLARSRSPVPEGGIPSNALPPAESPGGGQLTDQQKADVIRRHLLSADEQQQLAEERAGGESGVSLPGTSPLPRVGSPLARAAFPQDGDDDEYPTPYHLEGGDVVAGVYKWAAQQQQAESGGVSPAAPGGVTPSMRRSKSMASLVEGSASRRASHAAAGGAGERAAFRAGLEGGAGQAQADDEGFSTAEMLQPGGFRRDFVFRRMAERGETPASGAASDQSSEVNASGYSLPPTTRRPTRSFIDFLSLYGHFGGEDLEEIEEEDEDSLDDEEAGVEGDGIAAVPTYDGQHGRRKLPGEGERGPGGATERTPLVRSRSTARDIRGASKKRTSMAKGEQGDATVTQAVMMLLKSFVGTGVLFLGKAFYNGGILFSVVVLCLIAMISLYSFLLLVQTRLVVHGSFGDIGGILYGKYMRWAILGSIVLSQIGFVAAYTIFVAENLQAFFLAVSKCHTWISIPYLILAQLVILLPLAMVRNIQKLSATALIADAFILFGLIYIFSNEISTLAHHGIADVALFNPKDFPLLIGTAVFAFEGIGLIIPITESMKEPHKFPRVLTGVMIGVMILFAGGGTLGYLTFGSKIQTVVFVNLPQDDKFVNASQFLYSIAILLSTPLQLFPAVRIMENGLFAPQKSGKHSVKVKWEKNAFRTLAVFACAMIAWLGANDLDKFVSLIGSLACVPLGLVYPAMLHYKACARNRRQKALDIALMIFGVVCTIYTTQQTIQLILTPSPAAPPPGNCPPRH
ncbi:hypothetical protein JCM10207_002401 [Rhodosporidiobolus poonsookiae]